MLKKYEVKLVVSVQINGISEDDAIEKATENLDSDYEVMYIEDCYELDYIEEELDREREVLD